MAILEELYSRDPNKWTNEEIEQIVAELRASRSSFVEQEKAAAAKAKAEKPVKPVTALKPAKPAKPDAPMIAGLSLASLGIQIVPPSVPATPVQTQIPFGPSEEEPLG
jgi:hypothetical protein